MKKAGIKDQLESNTKSVLEFLTSISEEELNKKVDRKWSIAENAIHLNKSVSPINIALNLPKISFLVFGKSVSSRSNEEIISAYKDQISKGAKASWAYIPKPGKRAVPSRLTESFKENYERLFNRIEGWSEEDLDNYRLPHPILGNLTVREMLYFTIYHMEHHLQSMKNMQ